MKECAGHGHRTRGRLHAKRTRFRSSYRARSKVQCELESELPSMFRVTVGETITIPPNSEIIVQGKINNDSFSCAQVIVEPTDSRLSERGILVAKSLVDVQTGELPLRLSNMSDDSHKSFSGTLAAKCEPDEVITSDVMAHSQNSGTSKSVTHSQNSGTAESVTHSQVCGTDECMGTFPKYGRFDSVTMNRGLSLCISGTSSRRQYCLRPKRNPCAHCLQSMQTRFRNIKEILAAVVWSNTESTQRTVSQ